MEKKETVGHRLRRLRTSIGLSQNALGAAAGITGATVHSIETGKQPGMHRHTGERLAGVLGVTTEYLMYGMDLAAPETQPPIEVYLRQTRPGLKEDDIRSVARLVRALEAEQIREMEGNDDAGDRTGQQ